MIQRADAPWGDTLDDLVAYAKEHPGEIRHISGGPGSGHDATMQSWVRRLGIEVKDIQSGTPAERALAVASGEGDINTSPVDVFSPHMDAGRVEPLMISGKDMPRAVGQASERAGHARLGRRSVRAGARRRRRARRLRRAPAVALRPLSRRDEGSGIPGEAAADQRPADPRSRQCRPADDRGHGDREGEADLHREGHLLGAATPQ